MTETLVSIDAPHFNAGAVLRRDRVYRRAPILHYMTGWSLNRIKTYCAERGWRCEVIVVDKANTAARFAADVVPFIK